METEYNERLLELMKLPVKDVTWFEYEGYIFKAYWPDVCKRYAKENPSKKFFIWLQDNYAFV